MKKLTMSMLSLFILILLAHGTLPAEKNLAVDTKSKVILPMEQIHEELPGPDLDDKKIPFIQYAFVLLLSTVAFTLKIHRVIRFESLFSFLTAVFFQSNYVNESP